METGEAFKIITERLMNYQPPKVDTKKCNHNCLSCKNHIKKRRVRSGMGHVQVYVF